MTAAQKDYLATHNLAPVCLSWHDARDVGFPTWGRSEAAVLPDERILLANGKPHRRTVPA